MKNEQRDWILRGAKTAAAREVVRQCDELRKMIGKYEREHRDGRFIADTEREGLLAIRKTLVENIRKEAERVRARIGEKEAAYVKDYRENSAERDRAIAAAERRYLAMDDHELSKAALALAQAPGGVDPQVADILMGAMRQRCPKDYPSVRELFVKSSYATPWLHDSEGVALAKELNFYIDSAVRQSGAGVFLIESRNQKGESAIAAASVAQVWEGTAGE